MKARLFLITTLFLSIFTLDSFAKAKNKYAQNYKFDPDHTSVEWSVSHFGFSNLSGKIFSITGDLLLNEKRPNKSEVSVVINMKNISTGLRKFDNRLKEKDLFHVNQFPIASFVSKKVRITGKNTAKIYGVLNLNGVTKVIILHTKLNKIGKNPRTKRKTAGFSAVTTIKRSDFNLTYGLPEIHNNVKLKIEAEANLINWDRND